MNFDDTLHEIVIQKTAKELSTCMQRALLSLFICEKMVRNGKTRQALMDRGLIRHSVWPEYGTFGGHVLTLDGMLVAIALCNPDEVDETWATFREPIISDRRLKTMSWLRQFDRRTT